MRFRLAILFLLFAGTLCAQQGLPTAPPGRVDSPSEWDKLSSSCGAFTPKSTLDCAEELFTGKPLHIAVGSIAPQNGFGAGLAYVSAKNTSNWRISWNADAIASNNASWRAGAYFKFVRSAGKRIGFHKGTKDYKPNLTDLPEHTVLSLYLQAISLNKLTYFGLGPASSELGRSYYGMRETIVGGNAVKPISARWKASLYGELNGRFVNLRPSTGQSSPSIGVLYSEATAPGLTNQPATFQAGEGIRMAPVLMNDAVRLNYAAIYQQFVAPGSPFSFQRLTFDLGHQYALHRKTTPAYIPRSANGPDDCSLDPATHPQCPEPVSRNFEGSIGFRVVNVLSMTPGGDLVPFYFQPTLGGSDINGTPALSSFQDYRFRAPNLLLLRESIEHSIWKLPLGAVFMADEGKLSLTRGGLSDATWRHSFSAGLTLRAGGFPEVFLLYAFGGERNHTIANVNTSLLGGSARPSLY